MSRLLYDNIIVEIIKILAQNGETRSLSHLCMAKKLDISIEEPLIFDHVISEKDRTFKLRITINPSEKITIDWGDGNVEVIENVDDMFQLHVVVRHVYTDFSKSKKYRVIISGSKYSVKHIGHLDNWADGITDFKTLGNLGITDLSDLFHNCSEFNGRLSENFNTTGVTDMGYMFCSAVNFNQPFPAGWDTENVRDMRSMFYNAKSFNQPLNFNTENVIDMGYMFCFAMNFNQSLNFDTKNVCNMSYMFSFATSFNQPLNWDTSNVRDMDHMFRNTKSFNQLLNFNVLNVTYMRSMFYDATSFNKSLNWKLNSITYKNLDQ